jgi:hypothetical protein
VTDVANEEPVLSVVLASEDGLHSIQAAVDSLRAQTICARLELVVVSPGRMSAPSELDEFHSVQFVEAPFEAPGEALAAGAVAARAPIVAMGEDHAFPDPDWAEIVVDAHRGPWAVVGTAVANANPGTIFSWANLLLAYGRWLRPVPTGPIDSCPSSYATYKRRLLLEFGEELGSTLEREGALQERLRAAGHSSYLDARTRLRHVNPSRMLPSISLRFNAGRLYAATRAERGGWSGSRKALYVAGSPLLPFLRGLRIGRELAQRGVAISPRVAGGLAVGVVLDAVGQLAGYARGPGDSAARLGRFEYQRERHITARDRASLFGGSGRP